MNVGLRNLLHNEKVKKKSVEAFFKSTYSWYIYSIWKRPWKPRQLPTPRKLLTFIAGHSAVNLTGSLRVWPQVLVGRSQRLKWHIQTYNVINILIEVNVILVEVEGEHLWRHVSVLHH